MPLNADQARRHLYTFDLTTLFIVELGWDRHAATLNVSIDGQEYVLRAIAQKRGMVVYTCAPGVDGRLPPVAVRREIEQRVAALVHEHLIIFHDAAKATSIWQWVRRVVGQPAIPREEFFHRDQPGTRLLQRLQSIAFDLEEEQDLTLTDVISRVRSAFDVEKITQRFYDGFKGEHDAFSGAVQGIPDPSMQRWYTSIMLNRLMFTYFVQKKGFLNGDPDYLRTHYASSRQRGRNRYYTEFLRPLFFEGFSKPRERRSAQARQLLGDVPYLNGGLFQQHRIELQYGAQLVVTDEAFEGSLNFFDRYRWYLDDRPLKNDREINPEVLGYIFEKYINQKQMGAYYTKEDITSYIAHASIIPAIFDQAQADHPQAFVAQSPIWNVLGRQPDCYIPDDMQHGVQHELPPTIRVGQRAATQRRAWNAAAPASYALPTETWRDVVARRTRYEAIQAWIAQPSPKRINDLITWNLDLARFAQDVLATTDDANLLRSFWESLAQLTILDPTCGSGAFLFAALNVLQPLYATCLDRMAVLAQERSTHAHDRQILTTFQSVLQQVASHPNREYFILKSIIVNNLYGVDIMEEAVEICKLRLFLKLAAQIEYDPTKPNQGAEPLPDIDFNIFTGNTLVGYATATEVQRAVHETIGGQVRLPFDQTFAHISARIEQIDQQFARFRSAQTMGGSPVLDKREVQQALDLLDTELNHYLASQYGIDPTDYERFQSWQHQHLPFHWFVKFYHVLQRRGGFDVVIGNPPYVGYSKIRSLYAVRDYLTERCANLYAFAIERSLALLRQHGRSGMIVPIASVSTEGMRDLQQLYAGYQQWHSHWAVRPGKLFVGVDMNLTISLLQKTSAPTESYTTGYRRWSSGSDGDRQHLFTTLGYTKNPQYADHVNLYPKLGSSLEVQLLERMLSHSHKLRDYTTTIGTVIYYHSGGRYWRKALPTKLSSHYKPVYLSDKLAPVAFALLNSQLFYWYWISNSNCMDVVSREVLDLPVFALDAADPKEFQLLSDRLIESYYASNSTRIRRGEHISGEELNFDVQQAKPIIDEIDFLLAYHYDFTDEELDFVLNYDIKYRMGSQETLDS
ncbi:MAG: DNA methyltransferase [Roseiflexaceae bacterium]|nr:DNA methyltransferase [Roseiflexaceae bacterium]